MTDVKIIAIKDILSVTGVQVLPGMIPKTLDISGLQFTQATSVEINMLQAPEFIIISDTRLWAQIPNGQQSSVISTIAVYADKPSPTRNSVFLFEVGSSISGLTGLERLVQMFTKIALQTPGKDKFRPTIGGGLMALAGQNISSDAQSALSSSAVSAVNRARDQVVSLQNQVPRIPPDERLLSADVLSVGFDVNSSTLALVVSITAQSGQQAVANLSF